MMQNIMRFDTEVEPQVANTEGTEVQAENTQAEVQAENTQMQAENMQEQVENSTKESQSSMSISASYISEQPGEIALTESGDLTDNKSRSSTNSGVISGIMGSVRASLIGSETPPNETSLTAETSSVSFISSKPPSGSKSKKQKQ